MRVYRYRGLLTATFTLLIIGIVLQVTWITLLALLPAILAAIDFVSKTPEVTLTTTREIKPARPVPGDRISVRLEVMNQEDTAAVDVRIIDGMPDDLTVVDGSPSEALVIAGGESATIEYTLEARRGTFDFDDPKVVIRGPFGGSLKWRTLTSAGDTQIASKLFIDEPPTPRETASIVGTVPTNSGGSGIEFHTVREYQQGDPINRIDWRRLGRTGELATVNFHEHRGVSGIVLVDSRGVRDDRESVPRPGAASGVELCQYGGDLIFQGFIEANHEMGMVVLGSVPAAWIPPTVSDPVGQARLAIQTAATGGTWDGARLEANANRSASDLALSLMTRLPGNGGIVMVTPALDEFLLEVTEELIALKHPVTVVSPDLGPLERPGAKVAAIERGGRLQRFRSMGARVVDWPRNEALPVAVDRALRRWSE